MVEAVCRPEYQNLPGNITHTACKKPDPNCEIIVGELTADEKSQTLKAHNNYRSEVAQGKIKGFPKATNMYHLIWDDELADVAQAFTNQCDDSKHDLQGERFTTKFAKVGQNFAYNSDSTDMRGPDATGHIFNWFEEYKDFPPDAMDPFNPPSGSAVVTHFTQREYPAAADVQKRRHLQRLSFRNHLRYGNRPVRGARRGRRDHYPDGSLENLGVGNCCRRARL
ncbi:CRISP/Allergen/PR-1-like [Haemaphysalis longicornis]